MAENTNYAYLVIKQEKRSFVNIKNKNVGNVRHNIFAPTINKKHNARNVQIMYVSTISSDINVGLVWILKH
jgi:hypothetical protein